MKKSRLVYLSFLFILAFSTYIILLAIDSADARDCTNTKQRKCGYGYNNGNSAQYQCEPWSSPYTTTCSGTTTYEDWFSDVCSEEGVRTTNTTTDSCSATTTGPHTETYNCGTHGNYVACQRQYYREYTGKCIVSEPQITSVITTRETDNTPCNDGVACTQNDVCTNEVCSGTSYTCNSPTEPQCQNSPGTCNGDGTCTYTPKPTGTACNDGNECTYGDKCGTVGTNAAGMCLSTGDRNGEPCASNTGICSYDVCEINSAAPTLTATIDTPPQNPTTSTNPTISYSCNNPPCEFSYRLTDSLYDFRWDWSSWSSSSTASYSGLSPDTYKFELKARKGTANAETSYTWSISSSSHAYCSDYIQSACSGQGYCQWYGNKCEGTPSDCSTWSGTCTGLNCNYAQCTDGTHKTTGGGTCQWREHCTGTPTSCSAMGYNNCPTASADCRRQSAYCSGSGNCAGISSSSTCNNVGCNWNTVPGSCQGGGFCSSVSTQSGCNSLSEDGCHWSSGYSYCSGSVSCSSQSPSSQTGGSCPYGCTYNSGICENKPGTTRSCSNYVDSSSSVCTGNGCTYNANRCYGSRASCDGFSADLSTCRSNEGCGATQSTINSSTAGYSQDFNSALNRPGSYFIDAHCEGARCGNNRREGPTVYNSYSEYCDGSDLAGHSCPEYSCGSGNYQHGTLQCVAACNGPDTTLCWGDHTAPTASGNYNYGPDGENGWYKNNIPFTLSCSSTPDNNCNGHLGSHACVTYWCQGAGCNPLTGTQSSTGATSGEGTMIIRYQARDTHGLTSGISELKVPGTSNNARVDKTPPTLSDMYLDTDEVFGYPYATIGHQGITISMQTKAVDPTGADVISGLNDGSLTAVVRAVRPTNSNYATIPLTQRQGTIYYDYWTIPQTALNDRYYILYSMKDNAGNWRTDVEALNNFMWVGEGELRLVAENATRTITKDLPNQIKFTIENMDDEERELVLNVLDPSETNTPKRFWVRFGEGLPEETYERRISIGKFDIVDMSVIVTPGALVAPFNVTVRAGAEHSDVAAYASTQVTVVDRAGNSFFSQTPEPRHIITVVSLLAIGILFLV